MRKTEGGGGGGREREREEGGGTLDTTTDRQKQKEEKGFLLKKGQIRFTIFKKYKGMTQILPDLYFCQWLYVAVFSFLLQ